MFLKRQGIVEESGSRQGLIIQLEWLVYLCGNMVSNLYSGVEAVTVNTGQ